MPRDLFDDYTAPPTDTDGNPLPDITARKHQGAPASVDAFARVAPTIRKSWTDILGYLALGHATSKEYAAWRGVELNTISGRVSELRKQGRIVPTGERRDGAAVYRLA